MCGFYRTIRRFYNGPIGDCNDEYLLYIDINSNKMIFNFSVMAFCKHQASEEMLT